MTKLGSAFGALVDRNASEAYIFWGNLITSVICHQSASFCAALDSLSTAFTGAPFSTVSAGLLTYVMGRMVSKAAKTTPLPAPPAAPAP